jgi:hypothetical protein
MLALSMQLDVIWNVRFVMLKSMVDTMLIFSCVLFNGCFVMLFWA